jgi:hypothetical protein
MAAAKVHTTTINDVTVESYFDRKQAAWVATTSDGRSLTDKTQTGALAAIASLLDTEAQAAVAAAEAIIATPRRSRKAPVEATPATPERKAREQRMCANHPDVKAHAKGICVKCYNAARSTRKVAAA